MRRKKWLQEKFVSNCSKEILWSSGVNLPIACIPKDWQPIHKAISLTIKRLLALSNFGDCQPKYLLRYISQKKNKDDQRQGGTNMSKMWGGRFTKQIDKLTEAFTASIPF